MWFLVDRHSADAIDLWRNDICEGQVITDAANLLRILAYDNSKTRKKPLSFVDGHPLQLNVLASIKRGSVPFSITANR